MGKNYQVEIEQLRNRCNYKKFDFTTTKSLSSEIRPIGQDRAIEAIETALNIEKKGFNLFLAGESGCGKSSVIKAILEKRALNEDTPSDWVYINNFENDSLPTPLELPKGMAKNFSTDIDRMVDDFVIQVPKIYESKKLKDERTQIMNYYSLKESEMEKTLSSKIRSYGFVLAKVEDGYIANPINEKGELITAEDLITLSKEERDIIDINQREIQKHVDNIYRDIIKLDRSIRKKLEKHLKNVIETTFCDIYSELYDKYRKIKPIKNHLKNIREHILENSKHFVALLVDDEYLDQYKKFPNVDELTKNYKVNVFVNNSKLKGAPVIFENNPTITSLFGMIEYTDDPTKGPITSFLNIKPGKVHLANGGYLVLEAIDLYKNFKLWEMLKRVLRNEEIQIGDDIIIHSSRLAVRVEPQPIPVKFKVILVGDPELHNYFSQYDDIFDRLFKVKADFYSEIPRTEENENRYASFIGSKCSEDGLLHLDKKAVSKIIEHSSRMAEDKYMLSTNFSKIVDILVEADYIARSKKNTIITSKYIDKTIKKIEYRLMKENEIFQRWIKENIVYIDTSSSVIGQINGLTVLSSGEYDFGLPVRITAKTFVGELGIINIEREVRMSGKIHDKGVMILSGYIGAIFGQNQPLSFDCYITFEQQYYHIDGDSASSTELYAILSSLSGVPIDQGIAVTGSVNQNGEIQPIGGVNEKIEGFYELCRYRGFNKNGVIIPYANVRNLMLKEDIIEAHKNGDFTIYAIKTIEEGMKILTGEDLGNIDQKGTIFYKVNEKLKHYYKILNSED